MLNQTLKVFIVMVFCLLAWDSFILHAASSELTELNALGDSMRKAKNFMISQEMQSKSTWRIEPFLRRQVIQSQSPLHRAEMDYGLRLVSNF